MVLGEPVSSSNTRWNAYPGDPPCLNSQWSKFAVPGEYLHRELSAVFAGHRSLHVFNQSRQHAAVIFERFLAVHHLDANLFTEVLVVGGFIGILKATPSANVINQDHVVAPLDRSERRRLVAAGHLGQLYQGHFVLHLCTFERCEDRDQRRTPQSHWLDFRLNISDGRSTCGYIARRARLSDFLNLK